LCDAVPLQRAAVPARILHAGALGLAAATLASAGPAVAGAAVAEDLTAVSDMVSDASAVAPEVAAAAVGVAAAVGAALRAAMGGGGGDGSGNAPSPGSVATPRTRGTGASDGTKGRRYLIAPPPLFPLVPAFSRQTYRYEVDPGRMWFFEQKQGIGLVRPAGYWEEHVIGCRLTHEMRVPRPVG
jgi:hypothetical protein